MHIDKADLEKFRILPEGVLQRVADRHQCGPSYAGEIWHAILDELEELDIAAPKARDNVA